MKQNSLMNIFPQKPVLLAAVTFVTSTLLCMQAVANPLRITQFYNSQTDFSSFMIEVTNVSGATIPDLSEYILATFDDLDGEAWKQVNSEADDSVQLPSIALADGQSIIFFQQFSTSPAYATTGTNAAGAILEEVTIAIRPEQSIAIYGDSANFDDKNVDRNDLVDVFPLNFTNELVDQSAVRTTSASNGWDFTTGTTYLDFPSVWTVVSLSTVNNASATDNEYLGFFDDGAPVSGFASYIAAQSGTGGTGFDDDKNDNGIDNKTEYTFQLDNSGNTTTSVGANRPFRQLFDAAFVDDDATPADLSDDQFAIIIEVPTGVPTDATLRVVASNIPNDDPDDVTADPSTTVLATYNPSTGTWTDNNGTALADTPSSGLDTIYDSLPVGAQTRRFIYIDVNL